MTYLKSFLWNKVLMLRGDILGNYRTMDRWQWLDQERSMALQQERLKILLAHAFRHVPYYRKVLLEAGAIGDNGHIHLERFTQIPILTKSLIHTHYDELKSDDINSRKWYVNTSGGSTGEPVLFIQEKNYHDWAMAMKTLNDRWTGYVLSMPKIILWGSDRDLSTAGKSAKKNIGKWLRSEIWQNAYLMSPEKMLDYVKQINSHKPVQIQAYAESILELARYIEQENLNVYSPQSIVTTAGTLYPDMRVNIERIFGAPVFNFYGSREVGAIACECDHHKGLHVSLPTHYVEILKQDGTHAGPDEEGEVVITLLTNYAMPLIRYRIGDMAIKGNQPCSCGRAWPLLREVTGRITDNFVTRDKTLIFGGYFRQILYFRDWIKKYQIVQEDYDLIRVILIKIEKTRSQTSLASELNEITEKIQAVMGKDCRVKYEFVNDIAPSSSGKYLYAVSKVRT